MSTTTVRLKASQIQKDWHVIDAAGRPLGRVATEVATLLRGKHKPTFEPHLDTGDFVIVINASRVRVSGNKSEVMRYYRHSGFPGGLKSRTFEEQLAAKPEKVIEQAVWGMLPHGPLGRRIIKHLKVYSGPNHPHASQVVGSDRAREQREAAQAEAMFAPSKPRRLAPLPVPHGTIVKVIEPSEPVAAEAPKARTRKAAEPKAEAPAPAAAEEPTTETPEAAPAADSEEESE